MSHDLAIDYNTGDLLVSPSMDVDVRTGTGTVEQRIRVRLRVWYGEWDIDPTLGSRIHDVMRMPEFRAIGETELAIREALEPMDDVSIQLVQVAQDTDDPAKLNVVITYAVREPSNDVSEPFVLTTSLRVGG